MFKRNISKLRYMVIYNISFKFQPLYLVKGTVNKKSVKTEDKEHINCTDFPKRYALQSKIITFVYNFVKHRN